MSENINQASQGDASNPVFQIQRLYLKDISLEQPNAPQIFLVQGEPTVQIQIDIQFGQLQDDLFEVIVIGNVTTKVADKVLFLRSNIADLIGRAGFQPIHLSEINFHQLYEQKLSTAAANQDANSSGIILPN